MVSAFYKLGDIIAKHPRAIVALWVVALIVSVPLAGVFASNLDYDLANFLPRSLDSVVAIDKYEEQYPGNALNQMIVVVGTNNSTQARLFIDDLDGRVRGDPAIGNITETSSVYSLQRDMVVNMTPGMHGSLYDALDNTSDGNRKLYDAADGVMNISHGLYWLWDNVTTINDGFNTGRKVIRETSGRLYSARDLVQGMADVFYGVPSTYVQEYRQAIGGGANDPTAGATAYQNTKTMLSGYPPDKSPMATGYLEVFYGAWAGINSTDPQARAQSAISSAAPAFVNGMYGAGAVSPGQRDLMLKIASAMTLDEYTRSQAAAIDRTTIDLAVSMAPGADRNGIADIYNLGRNPSDGAIGNYLVDKTVAGIRGSDEGGNMSASDLKNATDMVRDAWNLGPMATKQDFDGYVLNKFEKGLNATEKQAIEEVWGWGPDPNETVIRSYILREIGKDLNASENETFAGIYDLGRNASNESVKGFVVSTIEKGLNLTGNGTYFAALLALDRNLTDGQLEDFARDWEATHGYDDPNVLPDPVVKNLAAGNVTLYTVQTRDKSSAPAALADVKLIRQHIADLLKDPGYAGVDAHVIGSAASGEDTMEASMDNTGSAVTILLVLVLLGLYFRSVLTPFAPFLCIIVALIVAMGLVGVLSIWMPINVMLLMMLIAIMMGVGTDYCVFMISRFKEERALGTEAGEAVRRAVDHAGKSVTSSGFTAAIGFGSLSLLDLHGIFFSVGVGLSIGIMCAILVTLTLVPAVLVLAGDRVFWPWKIYRSGVRQSSGFWRSMTTRVIRHARLIIVLAVLVTVPSVMVLTQLHGNGDGMAFMPESIDSKAGYTLMTGSIGSGAMERSMVLVTLPINIKDGSGNYSPAALDRVESLSALLADTPGVDRVYSMTRPEGEAINYADLSAYKGAEKMYYETYRDNSTGKDGRTTVLGVSFVGSPYSEEAGRAVDALREKLDAYERNNDGTAIWFGGGNVIQFDYLRSFYGQMVWVVPLEIVGVLVVLVVLLRSVFTPLRLILTLLMGMGWTLAVTVLVFQFWLHVPLKPDLPFTIFCLLLGLGTDYDIFLVSRIREEVLKGKPEEEAIVDAVQSTGTIITLCGAVMAAAFGAMLLAPMLNQQVQGFALAFGIIVDATIIRMVVVPAVMVLLKKYNWWMPFGKGGAGEKALAAPVQEAPK